MAENSRFWDGHTVGDSTDAPYSDLDWADTERWKYTEGNADQGVINDVLGELLVYGTASENHVHVATGAALVNGRLYYNDAAVSIAINGVSTWWIIGLFSDESAHTIRVFGRGGYGSEALALASLVQVVGGDWEIPLATVQTDGAGLFSSVTDERVWAFRSPNCDFIPAVGGAEISITIPITTTPIDRDYLGVPLADNAHCIAYGHYRVLHRYHDSMIIIPVVISAASGDCYNITTAHYEQIGKGYFNTHEDTFLAYDTAALIADHISHLKGPTVTEIEEGGGDFICITTERDSNDPADTIAGIVYVAGWKIYYHVLY